MTAKLYRRAQIEATRPDTELARDDYEGRALRALWVHRWLDEPDRRLVAALKGGRSAWPEIVRDMQAYGSEEAKEPKPRLKPADITDSNNAMPWFNGIESRAFSLLWNRGALGWSFQRMADSIYRPQEDARRFYNEAMHAVIINAARGSFEV